MSDEEARYCPLCAGELPEIARGEDAAPAAAEESKAVPELLSGEMELSAAELAAMDKKARSKYEAARKRRLKKELKEAQKAERDRSKTIRQQLKSYDKELREKTETQRLKRRYAKDVYEAIAFDRMFANGLCEVEEGLFSETIAFDDISYQSAREESQKDIFQTMASLLDYFGSDTSIQYTITNTPLLKDDIGKRRFFEPAKCGERAPLARQFNEILNDKVASGSSNIVRNRYLTYATAADNAERAAQMLSTIRSKARQTFAGIRSGNHVVRGVERLGIISSILRPGRSFDFDYDRDLSLKSPLTAKDFICPTSLNFRPENNDSTYFKSEDKCCQVLVIRPDMAAELTDRAVATVLDLPIPMVFTWHLQPIDKAKAVSMVRRQEAWIQKEVIEDQKQAIQSGYDYTILPPELETTRGENRRVLDSLLHKNQRLYYFTGLIYTYADDRTQLDNQVIQLIRTCHSVGFELATLDLRQREGMNSVLPLAHNHVDVHRDLYTAEATVLMPFTTQELDVAGGGYYGQNRLSGNLVICNRKKLMNPHGFITGMSGAGKSFAVKREMENTLLAYHGDEIFSWDVTGEYAAICEGNGGTNIEFGPDSKVYCNPFDMAEVSYMSYQAALAWKIDAILAMTSALKAEGGQDLTQEERSVVATCVEDIYAEARKRKRAEDRTPTLGEFVDMLDSYQGVGSEEAKRLALIFNRYVTGPLSFLNHRTNFDTDGTVFLNYNMKQVPGDMRVLVGLANLENARQRLLLNHEHGRSTWFYIDEIQSYYAHPAILAYLARLWRETRQYGGIMTGMTQSAAALAGDENANAIVEQSDFLLILRQSDADRRFWTKAKGLSSVEASYIDDKTDRGSGLLMAGPNRVPFFDDFPNGNDLYDLFSTSPEDYARIKEKRLAAKKEKKSKKSEDSDE